MAAQLALSIGQSRRDGTSHLLAFTRGPLAALENVALIPIRRTAGPCRNVAFCIHSRRLGLRAVSPIMVETGECHRMAWLDDRNIQAVLDGQTVEAPRIGMLTFDSVPWEIGAFFEAGSQTYVWRRGFTGASLYLGDDEHEHSILRPGHLFRNSAVIVITGRTLPISHRICRRLKVWR